MHRKSMGMGELQIGIMDNPAFCTKVIRNRNHGEHLKGVKSFTGVVSSRSIPPEAYSN
jgi:hypothetical protein